MAVIDTLGWGGYSLWRGVTTFTKAAIRTRQFCGFFVPVYQAVVLTVMVGSFAE